MQVSAHQKGAILHVDVEREGQAYKDTGFFLELYTFAGFQRSRMAIKVDQFSVSDGTTAYSVFAIEGGVVKIINALIDQAQINNLMVGTSTGANSATVIDLEDLLQGIKFNEEVPTLADRAAYDGEAEGFRVLVANVGDGRSAFFTKQSAAVADWSVAFYITGPTGGAGPYTDITIGATTTLPAGSPAEVTLVPVSPGVIQLKFALPKGADGTGTGDFVGPAGGVAIGDLVAFANATGRAGRKATPAEVAKAAGGIPVAGYISPGFNLANSAGDLANDIDFPTGIVASAQASPILMSHVGVSMQLDVAWGVGNGGRFDAGAVSDGWWHCFVIGNGTLVTRGFSKSLDPTGQQNYPAGFAHYRRVGSVLRVGGSNKLFVQNENNFDFVTPILERSSSVAFASALLTVSVPSGIPVQPKMKLIQQQNASGAAHTRIGSAGGPLHSFMVTILSQDVDSAVISGGIFTDTASRIQFNVDIISGSIFTSDLTTTGWIDSRGRG